MTHSPAPDAIEEIREALAKAQAALNFAIKDLAKLAVVKQNSDYLENAEREIDNANAKISKALVVFSHLCTDNATLKARVECLEKALLVYADQYCEFGPSNEGCGKFSDDICGGCRARQALQVSEGSGCELCDYWVAKGKEPIRDLADNGSFLHMTACGYVRCTRRSEAG